MSKIKQPYNPSKNLFMPAADYMQAGTKTSSQIQASQPPVLSLKANPEMSSPIVQRLPYRERMQDAFGGKDISNVKAKTNSAANEASKDLGANAYATENDVAFKTQPDLHTAAHEAAHVVQNDHNRTNETPSDSQPDLHSEEQVAAMVAHNNHSRLEEKKDPK